MCEWLSSIKNSYENDTVTWMNGQRAIIIKYVLWRNSFFKLKQATPCEFGYRFSNRDMRLWPLERKWMNNLDVRNSNLGRALALSNLGYDFDFIILILCSVVTLSTCGGKAQAPAQLSIDIRQANEIRICVCVVGDHYYLLLLLDSWYTYVYDCWWEYV